MTQDEAILRALIRGERITRYDAEEMCGAGRLSSRIHRLKTEIRWNRMAEQLLGHRVKLDEAIRSRRTKREVDGTEKLVTVYWMQARNVGQFDLPFT